ncbi:STM3941 family protein [Aquimarina sp. LLG6339-5]|uniref:STM3941 family protein n=1 Tax=Aquimarina sp. LLG6339-5 TaxID=3160830 RepID=UPI0038702BF0
MRNETKIFRQNKLKNLMLFLICSVFVAIGILMLKDKTLIGWFIISFFGFGIIISLIQFHPNASYLKLTDEGFETKNLFRSNFTKWTDIKEFRQGYVYGNKMIFFDYTDEHKKWNSGKKVAKFLSGKEGAVQSSYNISTDKLIELMIEYKLKSKNVVQHGV